MTDTSNPSSGGEAASSNTPASQEPAPVASSIDEFPTVIVGAGGVTPLSPVEDVSAASTLIAASTPFETATYVTPAEAEPETLLMQPEAALPTVAAPIYPVDGPAVQPLYAQTAPPAPYLAPPPDGPSGYYPGFEQQPGWTGALAPAPAPRKSRRGLLILIIVLVALLIGGGTAFALIATRGPSNTPTQVLQQYCDAYKTYNAQELYNTLDAAGQASTSISHIQQGFDTLKSLGGLVTINSCNVSNVQQNGSRASGTVTITESVSFLGVSNSASLPVSFELLVENNVWKIDPSAIKSMPFTEPTFTLPTFPPGFLTPTDTGSNQ